MIGFATLLLGLVLGPRTVELDIAPGVESVVLELDGQVVASLSGPPWSATCDFGERLQPHRLVATAFGPDGEPLESAETWINLPRGAARLSASLRPGETPGVGDRLLLHWQNVYGDPPTEIHVTFDGVELAVDDPSELVLPEYDPETLHVLDVEVVFPNNLTAVEQLTIGGGRMDRSARELTGVPVLVGRARADVAPASLAGALKSAGKPVQVNAVEEGPAQLVVVIEPDARDDLERLLERGTRRLRERRIRLGHRDPTGRGGAFLSLLGQGDWMRFVWPFARPSDDSTTGFDIFEFSREFTRDEASFVGLLRYLEPPHREAVAPERLADAVAVAGLLASTRSRRRAVIVVLGDVDGDASTLPASTVRDYLASLGVPLFVWTTTLEATRAAEARWGDARRVASIYGLEDAIEQVGDHLARQRIVWLEGALLPQSVEAVPGSGLTVVR